MAEIEHELETQTILLVPNILRHRGYGHMKRCIQAAQDLKDRSWIYIPRDLAGQSGAFDEKTVLSTLADLPVIRDFSDGRTFDIVVLDCQATPMKLLREIEPVARRLVGWDEGGEGRKTIHYLLDSLPNLRSEAPNLRSPEFLDLGPAAPFKNHPIARVLVTFGGADAQDLTHRMLHFLRKFDFFGHEGDPWSLTVVEGPLFGKPVKDPDVDILKAPSNIQLLLPGFDLVICSFGITAMEAIQAGVPVLLLNPTSYHEKLSRQYAIPSLGVIDPSIALLSRHLIRLKESYQKVRELIPWKQRPISEFLRSFRGGDGLCPVCRTGRHPVLFRTEHKTFFSCQSCGMEYMHTYNLAPKSYSQDYFFEEYKKQYGKTYLDDFAHIKGLGKGRLAVIRRLSSGRDQKLLDVGCAFGPFLAAAAEAGFSTQGVDVSQPAVDHVAGVLGLKAECRQFADPRLPPEAGFGSLDVLTMWYVIEHFPVLDAVLTRANRLLKLGGILAFSTPNGRGLTRTFRASKFFTESPDDHFSIWNPSIAGKVLKRFGFQIKTMRITGHHPERFPGLKKIKGPRYFMISVLSLFFGWGDTFEVYAEKVRDVGDE